MKDCPLERFADKMCTLRVENIEATTSVLLGIGVTDEDVVP